MRHLLFVLLSVVISNVSFAASSSAEQKTVDDLLAIKLHLDQSEFAGVQLNKGGGYDWSHSKLEVGNFLLNFSVEKFAIDWNHQDGLAFARNVEKPLAEVERYYLKAHFPYRLDNQRLWLGHLGAEWAYENEVDDALSVQAFLLYSEYLNSMRSWQLGMYLNHHPVESVLLPIIEYTYNYPFKERTGYYGHIGFPKTQLGYFINSQLRTDIGFVYHQATIKLAEESLIQPGGFFQSKNWRTSWQLHYLISKEVEVRLGVDASISNKLILYNRDYEEVDYYYGDKGAGWHLGLSYQF